MYTARSQDNVTIAEIVTLGKLIGPLARGAKKIRQAPLACGQNDVTIAFARCVLRQSAFFLAARR
jgi:hypothetical protein